MESTFENLPSRYELDVTTPEQTGIRLYVLKDNETGVELTFFEFNKDIDVHTLAAWVASRTSRSKLTYEELFSEVVEVFQKGGGGAADKLAKVFVNYGHASVADLAPVMIGINKIPIMNPFWFFNHASVGAGQELSTRYVDLDTLGIPDLKALLSKHDEIPTEVIEYLEDQWTHLQSMLASNYNKWSDVIAQELEKYLLKHVDKVSPSTLKARTLDIARMWIPAGAITSMSYLGSVRSLIDMIQQLHDSHDPRLEALANQLFTLLNLKKYEEGRDIKADFTGLTKYSEGRDTIKPNLENLKEFLENRNDFRAILNSYKPEYNLAQDSTVEILTKDKSMNGLGIFLALQYITVLYPHLDEEVIYAYLNRLSNEDKTMIGDIILNGHNHHNLMRNMGDVRGELVVIETALAYVRDLNRHRSMGRLVPLLESENFDAIIKAGFNKNYQLRETEALRHLQEAWEDDMARFYYDLWLFYNNCKRFLKPEELKNFLPYILPLGHQIKFHISGPLTQFNYLESLRIGLGGDFGYRDVVYQMLEEFRADDPFLANQLNNIERPDPNSISQIVGRS